MGVPYYRLSGAGNDFLALVSPEHEPEHARIRAWCARAVSVGADGLFTLARTEHGARMRYWNADGSVGRLCLNGSRCAAQLAFRCGWGTSDTLVLDTDAGPLEARSLDDARIVLHLPPIVGSVEPVSLTVTSETITGWRVTVGVPHLIIAHDRPLDRAPLERLGPPLRHHEALAPDGANVSFARFRDRHRLDLRTYERGVEAETLACGTGAIAAVAVGVVTGRSEAPVTVRTAGGFTLVVTTELRQGRFSDLTLEGDARVLATGEILPGADELPEPPDWTEA